MNKKLTSNELASIMVKLQNVIESNFIDEPQFTVCVTDIKSRFSKVRNVEVIDIKIIFDKLY